MTIYLIARMHETHDYYGNPVTEFEIWEDYGYFTSKEAAQAWIDAAKARNEEQYKQAVRDTKRRNRETKKKNDEILASIQDSGLEDHVTPKLLPLDGLPSQSYYTEEFEIVEVEPA